MSKKILIVTPKFPYPIKGACEADRAVGIELFKEMGFDVAVFTKVYGSECHEHVRATAQKLGIKIVSMDYEYLKIKTFKQKLQNFFYQIRHPGLWDGAALEYSWQETKKNFIKLLDDFKPDLVWFDYTYLWPLYSLAQAKRIPIYTRSINFEPWHFLEEDGKTLLNFFKVIPKLWSEYVAARQSKILFAISPKELGTYKKISGQAVLLPLRGLSRCLTDGVHPRVRAGAGKLNVFFSGSTYNVHHNRQALAFLLSEIIPKTFSRYPDQFCFHIFGGKIPQEFSDRFIDNIKRYNFLEHDRFLDVLAEMDIAIAPSLFGGGMQQKIFEPLTRGFPTITSARGLAGYHFKDNEQVLVANSATDFVDCLGRLQDPQLRERLSREARSLATQLFSTQAIKNILSQKIN